MDGCFTFNTVRNNEVSTKREYVESGQTSHSVSKVLHCRVNIKNIQISNGRLGMREERSNTSCSFGVLSFEQQKLRFCEDSELILML